MRAETRELYNIWKLPPKKERLPHSKAEFARQHGISVQTLCYWDKKDAPADISKRIADLSVEEQIKIFDRLLFAIIQNPHATAKDRELFGKRYGLLVEKKEAKVEIGLTADEITRRNLEAERRLREEVYRALPRPGVEEVQGISPLLSNEIRLDSEQEHRSDN